MKHTGLLLSLPAMFVFPPSVPLPTLFVFNPDALEWVPVCGAKQNTALSGFVAITTGQNSGVLDGDYLATMDGLAILTSASAPIATQPLHVVALEEHILTSAGDKIAV